MKLERLQQLAALHAAGALSGKELESFRQMFTQADAATKAEIAKFQNLAALVALASAPAQAPSANVKEKLLQRLNERLQQSPSRVSETFALLRSDDESGWQKLPIPGTSVKILSIDRALGYAVLLGKLEAGARYPAHRHFGSEDIYMLSGDLHIEGETLRAGDFHHAASGTTHGVNYSEQGCTLLAIISTEDLAAQADPNSAKWITR
jgi:quercetin dioxygenase-like cupin family protein